MLNVLISIFLITLLTACGQGLKINQFESQMALVKTELTEFEKASYDSLAQLQTDLDDLQSLNLNDFENVQLKLSDLRKIKANLGNKLDKITDKIKEFKGKLTDLKLKIQNYITLLDPNDPTQSLILDRLQKLLDQIAKIEQNLDRIIDLLNSQLNFIDDIFDKLIGKLNPNNPVNIVIRLALEAIKDLVKSKIGFSI